MSAGYQHPHQQATTCSTNGCHGRLEPATGGRIRRDEYTVWVRHDPHARAYDTLFTEPARRMADQTTPGWAGRAPEDKATRGMTRLTDPARAARVCAGCHVGAPAEGTVPARDVNHDLLAAGHPRLTFEFTTYLANLPPHWNLDASGHEPLAGGEAWALGRVEAARSAVRLLAHRATADGPTVAAWPEFAEFACASCHHTLVPAPADRASSPIRKAGSPRWGEWDTALLAPLADSVGHPITPVERLREAMERFPRDPRGIPAQAAEADRALEGLGRAVRLCRWEGPAGRELAARVVHPRAPPGDVSWDAAVQRCLALTAFIDNRVAGDQELRDALREAAIRLTYRPGNAAPDADQRGRPFHADLDALLAPARRVFPPP